MQSPRKASGGYPVAGIVLIAPDKQVFLQGKTLAREFGTDLDMEIFLAREDRAVALARKLEASDVDVIISRGGTARLIAQADVRIPVVEIPVTAEDLVFMMREARRITGLEHPRVLIAVFTNWLRDAMAVAGIMGIELTVYARETEADTHAIIERIDRLDPNDFDIVVAGKKTLITAARRGFKTLPTSTGLLALKNAILEARRVALGRKIEKEHAERFTTLVQYASEGIISVDPHGVIQVLNPAAEQFLHCEAHEIVGQRIASCLHFVDLDACLTRGQESIGQTVQWRNIWLSFNIAPILVNGHVAGAIVTFQDVTRIQEMEARFRNEVLAKKFLARYTFDDIVGRSPRIEEAKRIAREMAAVEATVLVGGESGTGKELFAQSIHNASPRKSGPFVALNCAALPPNLLESELFGYVEGAFTGATKRGKPGLFEMAHRGTIFLDEISEMDKYGQSRLLRVLQEKQVMRLGDEKNIPVNVRVIAATNQDLASLVSRGSFRQDLYYRLKVLTVKLPPLRMRSGDVEILAESFIKKYNQLYGKHLRLNPAAYEYLAQRVWPGNIRELMSFVERLVVIANETIITPAVFQNYSEDFDESDSPAAADSRLSGIKSLPERDAILKVLEDCNQNRKRAAKLLGMDRTTLYRKLKRHGLSACKSDSA
jgi:PAS domain S-box-containing protein